MKPYWDDNVVKWEAVETIYNTLDTMVTPEDLETRRPAVRFFRRFVFVECPEFDDFYLMVFVDRNGLPVKTEVYTYD